MRGGSELKKLKHERVIIITTTNHIYIVCIQTQKAKVIGSETKLTVLRM